MAVKLKTLSREQIALVHIAAHKLAMPDADYRALLLSAAGVTSSRLLDADGFRAVMLRFEKLGFVTGKPGTPRTACKAGYPVSSTAPVYGERPGMASPAQVDAITRMWAQWHGKDDARALGHWLQGRYGVTNLRFVDARTAQKALNGLKAMLKRKAIPHTALKPVSKPTAKAEVTP